MTVANAGTGGGAPDTTGTGIAAGTGSGALDGTETGIATGSGTGSRVGTGSRAGTGSGTRSGVSAGKGSLLDDAVRELSAWAPADAVQDTLRREFVDFLSTHDDGVWRSCAPSHLTASAVILDPTRSAVLLVLHRKVKLWLQPGGHCEPDDASLTDAALREASEESGITGLQLLPGPCHVDRHRAPCNPGVVDYHLDVRYAILSPPGALPVTSEESLDVQWFPWDDLPGGTDSDLNGLVAAGRARLP